MLLPESEDAQHSMNGILTRRSFLKCSIAGIASLSMSVHSLRPSLAHAMQAPMGLRVNFLPPLYCIAYIDPEIPEQANQEAVIARYPLAIVPQSVRPAHISWRDRIKQLNPNILMLGYQMVIEQTTVPGPGHDKLREVKESWATYPNGFSPTVGRRKPRRLFDPRKPEWQQAFLKACRTTLESYPYDGLFLDQCSIFEIAHPVPSIKSEMREAIQNVLLKLRQEYPRVILIGNSSYNWKGLNGELNEGNSRRIAVELARFEDHARPTMNMYLSRLRHPDDIQTVQKQMALTHARGGFYGASVNYQRVLWFELFDKVMAGYKT